MLVCSAIACVWVQLTAQLPRALVDLRRSEVSLKLCIILSFEIDIYLKNETYNTNQVVRFGLLILLHLVYLFIPSINSGLPAWLQIHQNVEELSIFVNIVDYQFVTYY